MQSKLEAQYVAKREAHLSEVADLRQQLELRGNEVRSLNASIDSLKSVNEELKVGGLNSTETLSNGRCHRYHPSAPLLLHPLVSKVERT